jgi:large subunit ribosomal protein L21
VPYLKEKVGSKVVVEKILYLEDGKTRTVGKPFIEGKKIDAEVVSHGKSRKVVVFKFKRRKGYQVKNTHRDDYTILKFGKLGAQKKQTVSKKAEAADKKKVVTKKTEVKTKSVKKEKE